MPFPSTDLLPSESTYPEGPPNVTSTAVRVVRELPPLRLSVSAEVPNGPTIRWADDETNSAFVPQDLSFSTTIPGGFESLSVTLQRKPSVSYSDLTEFTNLRVAGPGGTSLGRDVSRALPAPRGMTSRSPRRLSAGRPRSRTTRRR